MTRTGQKVCCLHRRGKVTATANAATASANVASANGLSTIAGDGGGGGGGGGGIGATGGGGGGGGSSGTSGGPVNLSRSLSSIFGTFIDWLCFCPISAQKLLNFWQAGVVGGLGVAKVTYFVLKTKHTRTQKQYYVYVRTPSRNH